MKAIFSGLIMITFLVSQSFGNHLGNIIVPEIINKSFQKKYPNHTEPTWNDLGDYFSVTFYDENETIKEASFSLDGVWKNTMTNLDEDELPQNIKAYIRKKFGEEVDYYDLVFLETTEENIYLINIEVAETNEEEEEESQTYVLTFDEDGKFIKAE